MKTVITSFGHLDSDNEFFFRLPAAETGLQGLRCKKKGINLYVVMNEPEQVGKVEKAETFWLVEKIIEG